MQFAFFFPRSRLLLLVDIFIDAAKLYQVPIPVGIWFVYMLLFL